MFLEVPNQFQLGFLLPKQNVVVKDLDIDIQIMKKSGLDV